MSGWLLLAKGTIKSVIVMEILMVKAIKLFQLQQQDVGIRFLGHTGGAISEMYTQSPTADKATANPRINRPTIYW